MTNQQHMSDAVLEVSGLEDAPLGAPEGNMLRELLTHLKEELQFKYGDIARWSGVDKNTIYAITGSRSNGTYDVRNKLRKFCAGRNISCEQFLDVKACNEDDKNTVDKVLLSFGIKPALIGNSIAVQAGPCLMFTFAREDRVNVTWYQFTPHSEAASIPNFSAWRRNINGTITEFNGSYYVSDDSLFMFGSDDRGLARLSTLIPRHDSAYWGDRYGFTSGSSATDVLFAVPCYLKKLSNTADKEDHMHVIGERTLNEAHNLFPDILEFLSERRQLPYLIERSSSI